MRVVLSQTEKEMNVNNTKITAPINQLILSLLVRVCLLTAIPRDTPSTLPRKHSITRISITRG